MTHCFQTHHHFATVMSPGSRCYRGVTSGNNCVKNGVVYDSRCVKKKKEEENTTVIFPQFPLTAPATLFLCSFVAYRRPFCAPVSQNLEHGVEFVMEGKKNSNMLIFSLRCHEAC